MSHPLSFDIARQTAVWGREGGGRAFKISCVEMYGHSLSLIQLSSYESC